MLLAEVGVRCDKCGTSFVSRQLPTFIDIGYRNSELRQDYRGYNPGLEQYAIVTCPSRAVVPIGRPSFRLLWERLF